MNNKEKSKKIISKRIEALKRVAKYKWNILNTKNKGAYFISDNKSLIDSGLLLKKD